MDSAFELVPVGERYVITSSKLRAWWLVRICGYQLRKVTQTPQGALFGRIRYVRRIALEPPHDEC